MPYEGAGSERTTGALDGYLSWQHPHRDTQIYVHPQIVRILSTHALDRAGQASEIGGVLWGKAGPADSLIISDATLIPSSGPLFNTTGADARAIQQALLGRAPQASLSLAGYFRSSTQGKPTLTPQDQLLIRQNIQDPDTLFLVINPCDNGVCTAALFFWQSGHIQTDASCLELPFIADDEPAFTHGSQHPQRKEIVGMVRARPEDDRRPADAGQQELSLVAMLRESAMRNTPPDAEVQPLRKNASKIVPANTSGKRPRWAVRILGFISICLMSVLVSVGIYFAWPALQARLQRGSENTAPLGLGLQATPAADGQISLNWNPDAPEVLTAASGMLSITDGRRSSKLKLDTAKLRSGKLEYLPKTKDVEFRLELNTDQLHTVTESVRIHSTGARASRTKRTRYHEPPNQLARDTASTVITRDEPHVSHAATAAKSPELGISARSDSNPAPVPSPALPPSSVVTATISAPPQASQGTTYVPPRVLEEMMPDTTPMGEFARVSVEVSVDPDGHVTAAHALKDERGGNNALATIATAAAQKWRFVPATLNGKPVPAEYQIVFAFHRTIP